MKPIFQYRETVVVSGVSQLTKTVASGIRVWGKKSSKAMHVFNQAWGFEDGNCNEFVDGKLVSKGGVDNLALESAHKAIARSSHVTILVSVYKDGSKTFEIEKFA